MYNILLIDIILNLHVYAQQNGQNQHQYLLFSPQSFPVFNFMYIKNTYIYQAK